MKKPVIVSAQLYFSPPLGGAEISQMNYFSRLKEFYDIHVYCFMRDDRKFHSKEEFIKDGIHITRSPFPINVTIREAIKKEKPDLIITQLLGSESVVNEAYINDVPCIYFAHGVFEDICFGGLRRDCPHYDVITCPHSPDCRYAEDLYRHYEKYKKCKMIICNSEFMMNCFHKFFPELADKIRVISPDFNYDLFQYNKKEKTDKINVLAVNSSPLKGRDLIFDIAFKNQDIHVTYVDVRAPDYNFLSRSPNITIMDKVSREQMADLYQKADVTLITTDLEETFSGVACESILSGTPVVCTRKGNLPNLVKENKSGYIIDTLEYNEWVEKLRKAASEGVNESFSNGIRLRLNIEKNTSLINKYFNLVIKEHEYDSPFVAKEHFRSFGDKKIMFFAKFYFPPLGGGEYFIHNVLTHLIKKGFKCEGACYCNPDPRIRMMNNVVDWRGIKVHQLGSISYELIVKFFKEHKPDLVITQSFDAPAIVAAAKSLGIKTILGTHFWRNICEVQDDFVNMLTRPMNTVKIRKDLHRVFEEADELYVNSHFMQKAVKRYVGREIDCIINPILDKERVICENRDGKYVTIINPDVGKGGRLFLAIAKMMPDVEFMCVGFGNDLLPENTSINQEIRNRKNIIVKENTDKMSDVYAQIKILLVPSLVDETFSMVALEGMANGIPVLTTNYGNLPFLVGQNGIILDPFDPFLWKEKIESLMEDSKFYERYSKMMLDRSKAFEPKVQLSKFYQMVTKCIGE